jgi:hypothetical protein
MSHELVIGADGSYQWGQGTGGVVEGKAVGGGFSNRAGTMKVDGRLATFTAKDGSVESYTFLAMPGDETTVIAIGSNLFAKQ